MLRCPHHAVTCQDVKQSGLVMPVLSQHQRACFRHAGHTLEVAIYATLTRPACTGYKLRVDQGERVTISAGRTDLDAWILSPSPGAYIRRSMSALSKRYRHPEHRVRPKQSFPDKFHSGLTSITLSARASSLVCGVASYTRRPNTA